MSVLLDKLKVMGCDIDGAMGRFLDNEAFYGKCFGKMLQDPAFEALGIALKAGSVEDAFHQAHTLKGVLANMGITPLYDIVVQIVEPLRKGDLSADLMGLYEQLMQAKEEYHGLVGSH